MTPQKSKQTNPECEMMLQESDLVSTAKMGKKVLLQGEKDQRRQNQMQDVDPVWTLILKDIFETMGKFDVSLSIK